MKCKIPFIKTHLRPFIINLLDYTDAVARDSKGISQQNCYSEFTSKILGPPCRTHGKPRGSPPRCHCRGFLWKYIARNLIFFLSYKGKLPTKYPHFYWYATEMHVPVLLLGHKPYKFVEADWSVAVLVYFTDKLLQVTLCIIRTLSTSYKTPDGKMVYLDI